jgi:hypothetical protein
MCQQVKVLSKYVTNLERQFFQKVANDWNSDAQFIVMTAGDIGSCVLGAGIKINKQVSDDVIQHIATISSPSCGQGNMTWEGKPSDRAIRQLEEMGYSAAYDYGRMD